MVKEIVVCDRCGMQLGDNEKINCITIGQWERGSETSDECDLEHYDFCKECLDSVIRFIKFNPKTVPEIPKLAIGGVIKSDQIKAENIIIQSEPEATKIILPLKQKKKKVAPEQPTKSRRIIDYGKIIALANAGWDNKKIGEEMGMTPQQVSDAKWKAKKKMAAVNEGDEKNASVGSD